MTPCRKALNARKIKKSHRILSAALVAGAAGDKIFKVPQDADPLHYTKFTNELF